MRNSSPFMFCCFMEQATRFHSNEIVRIQCGKLYSSKTLVGLSMRIISSSVLTKWMPSLGVSRNRFSVPCSMLPTALFRRIKYSIFVRNTNAAEAAIVICSGQCCVCMCAISQIRRTIFPFSWRLCNASLSVSKNLIANGEKTVLECIGIAAHFSTMDTESDRNHFQLTAADSVSEPIFTPQDHRGGYEEVESRATNMFAWWLIVSLDFAAAENRSITTKLIIIKS